MHSIFQCHFWVLLLGLIVCCPIDQVSVSNLPILDNDTAAEVSLPSNCVVGIGEKGIEKEKSLLNCFLHSVQHIIQRLDKSSVLENVACMLRSMIEVCWNQCNVVHSILFMSR